MFRQFAIFIAFIILTSCGQKKKNLDQEVNSAVATDSLTILNDPKINLNIQTTFFSEIDSTGILVFPLSMTEKESSTKSYKEIPANNYWNIIFLNSNTNEYHLLTEKKILFLDYGLEKSSDEKPKSFPHSKYIFYTGIFNDYNQDKILNDADPKYLFVSDKMGNNFRQISPSNYEFVSWDNVPFNNKIILTVRKDSNNDKKFDLEDETSTFEIELEKGTEAKEIFANEFKNKLKIMFDKEWKRVKK